MWRLHTVSYLLSPVADVLLQAVRVVAAKSDDRDLADARVEQPA
jgi:hypothetical protein